MLRCWDIRIYARPALYVYELKVRVVPSKDTDTRIWTVTRTGDTLPYHYTCMAYVRHIYTHTPLKKDTHRKMWWVFKILT